MLRVLTLNHWGMGGDWMRRRPVLIDGLRELAPDLIAFQEVVKTDEHDTAAELVGRDYDVYHQTTGLLGDGDGAAIASRWPIRDVREVDQQVSPRTADFPATTLLAQITTPEPIGKLLFVDHLPSWKPQLELERELQTVKAIRAVEEIVADRPMHVVLAGDLDATPDAASIRFLSGHQSLDGLSVYYRDAWEAIHAGERRAHVYNAEPADARRERRAPGGRPADRLRLRPLRRVRADAADRRLQARVRRAGRRRLGQRPLRRGRRPRDAAAGVTR